MIKFASIEEMVAAKAKQTHESNLNYGGVFDDAGNRTSNFDVELRWAAKKVLTVKGGYAGMTIGVDLPEKVKGVSYIPKFGYVELI